MYDSTIPPLELNVTGAHLLEMDPRTLREFMKKSRNDDGSLQLDGGWDKLSAEELGRLGERLTAAADEQGIGLENALALSSILAKLSNEGRHTEQLTKSESPGSPVSTPSPGALHTDAYKEFEIACYHEVVDDGGWVPFELELLDEIIAAPENYGNLLRPYALEPDSPSRDDWRAASRILAKRGRFRMWQEVNRDMSSEDGAYRAFLEATRLKMASTGALSVTTQAGFEETIKEVWEQEKTGWKFEQENVREGQRGQSVEEYTHVVKARLERHGFTQSFRFLEDPKQQDHRTTQIEYLAFECRLLDEYTIAMEDSRRQYDIARQALVDSKLLKSHETPESLCTTDGDEQRHAEELPAEEPVQATGTFEDWISPPPALARPVTEATQCRNRLIDSFTLSFQNHTKAEKDRRRQDILIEWIRDRLNADVNPPATTKGGIYSSESTGGMSHGPEEVVPAGPNQRKRRREDPGAKDSQREGDGLDPEQPPAPKRTRTNSLSGRDETATALATESSDDGQENSSSNTVDGSYVVGEESRLETNGLSNKRPQIASLGDLPLEPSATQDLPPADEVKLLRLAPPFENIIIQGHKLSDGSHQYCMESTWGALTYSMTWIQGRPDFEAAHTLRRATELRSNAECTIVHRTTLHAHDVWSADVLGDHVTNRAARGSKTPTALQDT